VDTILQILLKLVDFRDKKYSRRSKQAYMTRYTSKQQEQKNKEEKVNQTGGRR
jgi:hypothetical protein